MLLPDGGVVGFSSLVKTRVSMVASSKFGHEPCVLGGSTYRTLRACFPFRSTCNTISHPFLFPMPIRRSLSCTAQVSARPPATQQSASCRSSTQKNSALLANSTLRTSRFLSPFCQCGRIGLSEGSAGDARGLARDSRGSCVISR